MDDDGVTPLHQAVEEEAKSFAQCLVDMKANLTIRDENGTLATESEFFKENVRLAK